MSNWYNLVHPTENISQGDIIFNCPFFVPVYPSNDLTEADFKDIDGKEITTNVMRANVIVLTQACDLEVRDGKESPKLNSVLVAPLTDAHKDKMGRKQLKILSKLEKTQFYLLDPLFHSDLVMGYHVVSFEKAIMAPWNIINSYSKTIGPRPRLKSPYLEQLSQHFANHFGRVALPENREEIIDTYFDFKDRYESQRKNHDNTWNQLKIEEIYKYIESEVKKD